MRLTNLALIAWNILLLLEPSIAFLATPPSRITATTATTTRKTTSTTTNPVIMTRKVPPSSKSPVSVVVSMSVDDNVGVPTEPAARVEPGSHEELMYILGVNLARQLGDIRPLVNDGQELANVAKGLLDTVVGRLDEEGQRRLLSARGRELDDLIVSRVNVLREKLEVRGREMLKNMAATEGVQTLNSGVLVHVLEHGPDGPGQGIRPSKTSVVQIHYHGTLSDGTVFDSTLGAEPMNFPLAQVVPGWREGVLAMHEGETAMLGIPPEQAYGMEGTPDGRIPGGATLFFKVQLIKVLTAQVGGSGLVGSDGKALRKDRGNSGLIY